MKKKNSLYEILSLHEMSVPLIESLYEIVTERIYEKTVDGKYTGNQFDLELKMIYEMHLNERELNEKKQ